MTTTSKPVNVYGYTTVQYHIPIEEDRKKYSPKQDSDQFTSGDGNWIKTVYKGYPEFDSKNVYRRKIQSCNRCEGTGIVNNSAEDTLKANCVCEAGVLLYKERIRREIDIQLECAKKVNPEAFK